MKRKFLEKSIFVFATGLILTALMDELFPKSLKALGIAASFWTFMAIFILIWLEERLYQVKTNHADTAAPLSYKLVDDMDRQAVYDQGIFALKAVNLLTLLIISAGAFYFIAGAYASLNPHPSGALIQLDHLIGDYLRFQNAGFPERWLSLIFTIMAQSVPLVITGLAFWMCQVYAYGTNLQRPLLYFCGLVFIIHLLFKISNAEWIGLQGLMLPPQLNGGYGWNQIELLQDLGVIKTANLSAYQLRFYEAGLLASILFYMPALIMAGHFIMMFWRSANVRVMAVLGLLLLGIMFICDTMISLNAHGFMSSLNVWCCLSLLSVTRKYGVRKVYHLYQ